MKNIIRMAVTLFMLAASITSQAESGTIKHFVGLWEGVSVDDGAHLILSITNNHNGTAKLLFYATFFGTCNGGRGVIQGTGKVAAKRSLTSNDFTLTCFETGDTVKFPAILTRNPDGTLTGSFAGSSLQTIFHQTSK